MHNKIKTFTNSNDDNCRNFHRVRSLVTDFFSMYNIDYTIGQGTLRLDSITIIIR